ncbi:uncharacterized protein BYT42DRAFT_592122 [Radiomyces spectabilis]|uniref:uncharacterized protein n=1 Tax=Radiomyces spectabilis TaxID=64574 RepID=UPI00221E48DD|nr:uncharacterized protein BYT42DRAFT_592122 [Radiomyces spectabilis]KAI8391790.1 hypothetical protein BYT42DRAFT_592122 [Radiomyces spectabilis]
MGAAKGPVKGKYPDPNVVLENRDIAVEIFTETFRREFPTLAREGLEFALFKTFTVPSVSKLLVATGEFAKDSTRRTEDTELILSEIIDPFARIHNTLMDNLEVTDDDIKLQEERSQKAIERLNLIHGAYPISNDDYLFTLALFLAEPSRWINSYEWREMDVREMNHYEKKLCRYSPTNWQVAIPTINHVLSTLPAFLRPIVFKFVPCLLEPNDYIYFGIDAPSWWVRVLFHVIVYTRAKFIRYCCLPRRKYLIRTPLRKAENGRYMPLYEISRCVYAQGYKVEELGPDKFLPKCPLGF